MFKKKKKKKRNRARRGNNGMAPEVDHMKQARDLLDHLCASLL